MSYIKKPQIIHGNLRRNELGLTVRDYEGGMSTLCAGCGHDSVTAALIQAVFELDIEPHMLAKMSGIGCSSKTPAYFASQAHGFNSVHGTDLDGDADCEDADCVESPFCANQDFDGDGVSNGLEILCRDASGSGDPFDAGVEPSEDDLDDLGLLPALRALARDFRESGGLEVTFEVVGALPALETLYLYGTPASAAAKATVRRAGLEVKRMRSW